MPANTQIWDAVQATDPKFTKSFKRGGGFSGTAINPTYLARRATETFGPCGWGWGVQVLEEKIVDGHPVWKKDSEGRETLQGTTKIHMVHIRLWYSPTGLGPGGNEGMETASVEQFGQTEFVGVRKDGTWFTDEEAPKKSITDAMSKALSLIGFGADVHLGMYDDSKYVASLTKKAPEASKEQKVPTEAEVSGMWESAIETATTVARLRELRAKMDKLPTDFQLKLSPAWEAKRALLEGGGV